MTPHEALEKYFGFREFLDAQEEIIDALLGGAMRSWSCRRAAANRSVINCRRYFCEGTTVVVSPLIALMKDQVDALQRRGISRRP